MKKIKIKKLVANCPFVCGLPHFRSWLRLDDGLVCDQPERQQALQTWHKQQHLNEGFACVTGFCRGELIWRSRVQSGI